MWLVRFIIYLVVYFFIFKTVLCSLLVLFVDLQLICLLQASLNEEEQAVMQSKYTPTLEPFPCVFFCSVVFACRVKLKELDQNDST